MKSRAASVKEESERKELLATQASLFEQHGLQNAEFKLGAHMSKKV